MRKKEMLVQLENLAESLGISVRYENLGVHHGGLCKLFGKQFLFVNKALSLEAKIELFINELKNFNLDNKFVIPELREQLTKEADNKQ
jgi:hypothetical protein